MKYVRTLGFDITGTLPIAATHEFFADGGQLVHMIDGRLRATVPPEGFDDYGAAYPAARPVIETIRAEPIAKRVVFTGELGREQAEQLAAVERAKGQGGAQS